MQELDKCIFDKYLNASRWTGKGGDYRSPSTDKLICLCSLTSSITENRDVSLANSLAEQRSSGERSFIFNGWPCIGP